MFECVDDTCHVAGIATSKWFRRSPISWNGIWCIWFRSAITICSNHNVVLSGGEILVDWTGNCTVQYFGSNNDQSILCRIPSADRSTASSLSAIISMCRNGPDLDRGIRSPMVKCGGAEVFHVGEIIFHGSSFMGYLRFHRRPANTFWSTMKMVTFPCSLFGTDRSIFWPRGSQVRCFVKNASKCCGRLYVFLRPTLDVSVASLVHELSTTRNRRWHRHEDSR